jgi:hypothetical protein
MRETVMTNTGLPDPGLGRNPPRYPRRVRAPHVVGAAVAGFVIAVGVYFLFGTTKVLNVPPPPAVVTGQGNNAPAPSENGNPSALVPAR